MKPMHAAANTSGFSLIQVLIGFGLLSGLTLMFAQLNTTTSAP